MSFAAGRLNKRLRIDQLDVVVDTSGDPVQDPVTGEVQQEWVPVDEVWGAIEPLSARDFIQSASGQSEVSAMLVIRYRSDLGGFGRFAEVIRFVHVVNGSDRAIYNPAGFLADKHTGLEYLTIPVKTGVNDG